jgi:hypothetical protein
VKDGPVTYCAHCGVRAPQNAGHCPNCGAALVRRSNTVETDTSAGQGRTLRRVGYAAVAVGALWLLRRRAKRA